MAILAICLGLSLLSANRFGETGLARVLQESLVIIGWVAIWRPAEIFLVRLDPDPAEAQALSSAGDVPGAARRQDIGSSPSPSWLAGACRRAAPTHGLWPVAAGKRQSLSGHRGHHGTRTSGDGMPGRIRARAARRSVWVTSPTIRLSSTMMTA